MDKNELVINIDKIIEDQDLDFEYDKDASMPDLKKILRKLMNDKKEKSGVTLKDEYCYKNIVMTNGKYITKDGKKFTNIRIAAKHNATIAEV